MSIAINTIYLIYNIDYLFAIKHVVNYVNKPAKDKHVDFFKEKNRRGKGKTCWAFFRVFRN